MWINRNEYKAMEREMEYLRGEVGRLTAKPKPEPAVERCFSVKSRNGEDRVTATEIKIPGTYNMGFGAYQVLNDYQFYRGSVLVASFPREYVSAITEVK